MIGLIKLYRRYISPLKRPCCRFTPTCSAYALEAFAKRGFFVGFILTVWRILRCNPFSKGGYDPVPERGLRNPKAVACESEGTVTECDSSPDASCGTAKTVAQKGEDDLANATAQKGEDDLADATAQKSENDSGIHRDNSSKAEAEDGTALHSENVGSIKNLSPSGDSTEE